MDLSQRAEVRRHTRTQPITDFEFRDDSDDSWSFEGIASTVGYAYEVRDWMGAYSETIAEGAFKRTLNDDAAKISLHVNHQHGRAVPLATRHAGTLEMVADPHLRVRANLDPTRPDVQILRSALKRGEMTEMSIGFHDVKGGSEWNDDYTERTVVDMRLREASIVEDGANELTMASMRSLMQGYTGRMSDAEARQAIAFLEQFLDNIDDPADEVIERSGLFVSDELIALMAKRHGFAV